MKNLIVIFAVVCLANEAFGQVIQKGKCPNHPVVQNFDITKYLGRWYEIQRYESFMYPRGECVTADYNLQPDGSVQVLNAMRVPPNPQQQGVEGKAVVAYPNADPIEGKLNVTFYGEEVSKPNYLILDTDYDNYTIVWGCSSLQGFLRAEFAWVLARKPQISDDIREKINKIIDRYLIASKFRKTNQTTELCT